MKTDRDYLTRIAALPRTFGIGPATPVPRPAMVETARQLLDRAETIRLG